MGVFSTAVFAISLPVYNSELQDNQFQTKAVRALTIILRPFWDYLYTGRKLSVSLCVQSCYHLYIMQYTGLVVLVVAIVAGICSCQMCTLPTSGDLEDVIRDIIEESDSATTPNVDVMSIHPVCLALDDVQGRYRAVSVIVEYTCSGNTRCPSGTAVEQIESECDDGTWSYIVQSSPEFTRSPTPEANFSTSTRQDCVYCVSPELDVAAALSLSPDSVTHCVGESVTTLHLYLE